MGKLCLSISMRSSLASRGGSKWIARLRFPSPARDFLTPNRLLSPTRPVVACPYQRLEPASAQDKYAFTEPALSATNSAIKGDNEAWRKTLLVPNAG